MWIPAWMGKHEGARHLEQLRSDISLHECAEINTKCHVDTKQNLDAVLRNKDMVIIADILSLYACRQAPYSSHLSVCDNLAPKSNVLSRLYETSQVDFSDIGYCANNDDRCNARVRTTMDNMLMRGKDFVIFLTDIMLHACEHASYDVELTVCATSHVGNPRWHGHGSSLR